MFCMENDDIDLSILNNILKFVAKRHISYICLFGVLRRFQHCTGHITTGSWKGRGNQYIQFVRVLYYKLPTNGKQLPAFPLEAVPGSNPGLRGGKRECYHSATVAPSHISYTAEPQLSEPNGRHTIRSDNEGVQIDEVNRNSPSMGYQVDNN